MLRDWQLFCITIGVILIGSLLYYAFEFFPTMMYFYIYNLLALGSGLVFVYYGRKLEDENYRYVALFTGFVMMCTHTVKIINGICI